jgi:hypothetical protein
MSPLPTAILGRPGHWRVLPQLDRTGRGVLGIGHTAGAPCPVCALAERAEARAAAVEAVLWTDALPLWQVVLCALVDLGGVRVTEAALVVRTWDLAPSRASLRGYPHPDSRTVVARITDVTKRGYARRNSALSISATAEGRRFADAIMGRS